MTAFGRRLRGRLLIAASWLACRLPEGPLVRLADLSGDLGYRVAPDRAFQRTPSDVANSASASILSGSGVSWTR